MTFVDFVKSGFGYYNVESKRPFIFIHINKTGGTSISRSLRIRRNPSTPIATTKNHRTAVVTKCLVGEEAWNAAYKFTVVRNPWARLVSDYKYRIKTNQNELGTDTVPFDEWVRRTLQELDPRFYDDPVWYLPQVDWLKEEDGVIRMDYIAKLENLAADFKVICNDLGIRARLRHENATPFTKPYWNYYSDALQQTVGDIYREDIERLGYEFRSD